MRVPREVQIYVRARQPIILYSDAPYDPETPWIPPRLGWVIFDPEPGLCTAVTHLLRQCVVDTWLPRTQQIYAAESMGVLAAVWQDQSVLAGRDIIWFIDNEAAASSMIRAAPPKVMLTTLLKPRIFYFTDWAVECGLNVSIRDQTPWVGTP